MRYFFDTEFIERGRDYPIDLISIGIVSEDGRELYLQNTKCEFGNASDWVWENVIMKLEDCIAREKYIVHIEKGDNCWRSPEGIADEIRAFVGDDPDAEFWAYYADYDHVVLCQLFGTMMTLPPNFPKYTMDLKQRVKMLGNPKMPDQATGEHNALDDARWVRDMHRWLDQYEVPRLVAPDPEAAEQLAAALKKSKNASVLVLPKDNIIDAVSKTFLPKPEDDDKNKIE